MIGETIGNFRIVSRLGRGGMGEVYLAEQTSIGTKVAVKMLLPQISADDEHVRRFFNEARAVQRIQHAGIVKIFDVGKHASGQAYLVMEYLEGESLARRIHRQGRLHPAEIADLGRQIASVLEATHGAGITHRDLKPENIYIVPDRELASRQRAKILDFGIAKLTGTLANVSPQTIGTMGTPAYMAPEQWGDASRVDWRADLYSLGCVAFEMTCGRPPFVCTTIAEACGKHLTEPPPRARALVPSTPPELDELLDQLLEKRAEDRPATMDEVVRRFDALAAQLGPAPAAPPPSAVYAALPGALPAGTPLHPPGATVGTGYGSPPPAMGATVGTGYGATRAPVPAAAPAPAVSTPVERRRRGLALALGGIALAGVGAAVAVVAMSRGGGTTTSPPDAFCAITAVPVLDGASTEPVRLRYAFRTYQKTEVTMIAQAKTTVVTDRGRESDDLTITLQGDVTWTVAGAEQFAGVLNPTGFSVEHKSATDPVSGKESHGTVRWRSDDPGPPPTEDAPLMALIGQRFMFTVGSRGQLVQSNIGVIQQLLTTTHASATIKAAFARDEVFRTMFLRLPEKPVRVGDTWPAGEYLHELPNKDALSAKLDLRLAAVSKDGKQVVIEAMPELDVDLTGTVRVVSKQTAHHQWAELDLGRGEIVASALHSCAKLELDANGTHTTIDSEYLASYDPRPIDSGLVPYRGPSPVDAAVATVADAAPIDAAPIDAAPIDAAPIDAAVRGPSRPRADAGVPTRTRPDASVAAIPPGSTPSPDVPADDVRGGMLSMLAGAKANLQACAPPGGAKVAISLKVGVDGRFTNLVATGADSGTNACVAAVLRPLAIPRGANPPVVALAFPVVLVAADGGTSGAGGTSLPEVPGKLQQVLVSANAAVLACGDGFLGSTQATVAITIDPDGSVSSASTPKTEPLPLRACVERTIRELRFMPSVRGKTVSYGYQLRR